VSDAGLGHLRGMTRLRALTLIDSPVTESGVRELERALPELQVTR